MKRLIKKAIHGFIATLDVTEEVRAELMQITPSNFVGNLIAIQENSKLLLYIF
jgi:hypothetical protein